MAADEFNERFGHVRARFAAKLSGKIDELSAAIPTLSGESKNIGEAIASAHRRVHDMCGIGPTIGFVETGRAARGVEQILRASLHAERGLSAEDTVKLQEAIDCLRAIAHQEIKKVTGGATMGSVAVSG